MVQMNNIKEKPILFSTPMVRAILDKRKTQTRRVINSLRGFGKVSEFDVSDTKGYDWHFRDKDLYWNDISHERLMACAKYQSGDLLWVRETWAGQHRFDHLPPRKIPIKTNIHYAATEDLGGLMKRPSIFMPRWAARIFLKVTNVRVERVQGISEVDAIKEGIQSGHRDLWLNYMIPDRWFTHPSQSFQSLWDSINFKRGYGWYSNPWVWVYEFEVVSN